MAKEKDSSKEKEASSPLNNLQAILNSNQELHFNNNDVVSKDYKISTGSLKLDIELGGGLGSGAHRLIGVREGGKTSFSLELIRNFQNTMTPNKNGPFNEYTVYFKAEGRLSEDILKRSGIDTNPERFFIVKSNIYEFVIDTMRGLLKNNKKKIKYLFVIDSIDGLITKAEEEKTSEDSARVGSSAMMLSKLFQKMSLYLSEHGHMAIFISQERSQISILPYAPKAQTQGNSSGGNAIQHYVNFALNFKQRFKDDNIYEDNDETKIIGHWCKVELLKTVNDNSNVLVRYPIKRREGIWREYEVADLLLAWDFYKKVGKWYKINTNESGLIKALKEKFGVRILDAFDGQSQYMEFFNDSKNKDIVDFLYEEFKKTLLFTKSNEAH